MDFKTDLYNLMINHVSKLNWKKAIDQAIILKRLKLNRIQKLNVLYVIQKYQENHQVFID